jgi:hypothetical protein
VGVLWVIAYRDKKVVGVFVLRFRAAASAFTSEIIAGGTTHRQ